MHYIFIKFLNKLTQLTTLDASGTTDIYEILEHTTLTNLTKLTLKETEHDSPEKNTQHKQIGYLIHDIFHTGQNFRFIEDMNYSGKGRKRKTARNRRRRTVLS